ncbi:hypothetical protein ACFYNO_41095 [Kitasatospora sp. NPDC006697]|uniref:hypothetical protein n=1 Tax=Kitasatospora sp. NPDC006697 TaxID=3364020 RepID=UPI0036814B5B
MAAFEVVAVALGPVEVDVEAQVVDPVDGLVLLVAAGFGEALQQVGMELLAAQRPGRAGGGGDEDSVHEGCFRFWVPAGGQGTIRTLLLVTWFAARMYCQYPTLAEITPTHAVTHAEIRRQLRDNL